MNLPSRESSGLSDPRRCCRLLRAHGREYIIVRVSGADLGWGPSMHWLEQPAVKWAVPIPLLLLSRRSSGRSFAGRGASWTPRRWPCRRELAERGEIDYRPMVALTLVALRPDVPGVLRPPRLLRRVLHDVLERWAEGASGQRSSNMKRYDELYLRGCGGRLTRIVGYLLPLAVWPLFFRTRQARSTSGCAARGFRAHAWIYALCVVVMVPVLLLVSRQPDFADYYPMYKHAGRSWLDFLDVGGRLPRAVLRAGDLLPRLLAARDAQLRLGRDLVDGRAVLHDPLRQAVPRGLRRR